ncbi:MAG: Cof-type HAD-IIB family hydrolase [Gordonia sp. (in: high G+C Gram-positive bacteria)]
MSNARLVFLDIDGTLIDERQQLRSSAVTAVQEARRAGHRVYLCTGRSNSEIPPLVLDIGFDGVISAGGGFVESDGEIVLAATMPPEAVTETEEFLVAHDIEYNLQALTETYPSPGLWDRVDPLFAARGVLDPDHLARLRQRLTYRGPAPRDGIAKATFFGRDHSTFTTVRDGLGDRYHVITGTMPHLGESGGEISMPGMHKGSAIVGLAQLLGVSIDDTIAIGDGSNDLEMLDVVGVGIAMGNANDTVKSHADEVTRSVSEDGVWHAFARHGLLGQPATPLS